LRAGGWTTAQLALWLRVTPGTVSRWANGRSMGTNTQRAELISLPALPAEFRARVAELLPHLEREVARANAAIPSCEEAGALLVAANHRRRAARIRARALELAAAFGVAGVPGLGDHLGDAVQKA
jgi:hypothetical protein